MIDALVTGAGGFIGQALCTSLRTKGWNILPLVRQNGDIAATKTWASLPPSRVVFHLAGRTFVPDSWVQSPDFVSANVMGTEHALAYCRTHGSRLVLASGYVYGIPQRLPIYETDPAKPNNPYALTKRLSEQLCEFASLYQGVGVTILRIFNVFGPGQRAEFLIPKILQQVENGREIRVQDLAPRRDYVYLSDLVDAFIKASDLKKGFKLVNIGSGKSLSVAEIVDKVQVIAGTQLPVIMECVERRHEIPDVVADISLANRLLGWQPRLSFEAGVAQLLRRL